MYVKLYSRNNGYYTCIWFIRRYICLQICSYTYLLMRLSSAMQLTSMPSTK